MTNFTDVKKFMETFGQEVKNKAEFPSDKTVKLRYDLIKEELDEFAQAIKNKDIGSYGDAVTYSYFGNKKIVCTCGSGITACNIFFALEILGFNNLTLYDGSWAEWGKKSKQI